MVLPELKGVLLGAARDRARRPGEWGAVSSSRSRRPWWSRSQSYPRGARWVRGDRGSVRRPTVSPSVPTRQSRRPGAQKARGPGKGEAEMEPSSIEEAT